MKIHKLWLMGAMGLFAATSLRGDETATDRDPLFQLEAFIVEETGRHQAESLSPLSVNVSSLFGRAQTVEEIPRAITVMSAELREWLGIDSYAELDRFGAGTQRINYFGLAGSAFLRGMRAGTYFNGMLRAYQRNEMPTSFGSLDGLEIIKGPVPAGFSPTMVGGGVNQRPKQPFFDRRRGSIELGVGSWQERQLQFDYGAPLLLGDVPAAYRISYNHYRADRFYENVPHAFDSLYAAATIRVSDRHRLFIGGEAFDFSSSEIPGSNRPTQAFIDRQAYVIGEPPLLTSPEWNGNTVRTLLEFPFTFAVNPQLHALAISGDIARARIPTALRGLMLDLSDLNQLQQLYTLRPLEDTPPFAHGVRPFAQELLNSIPLQAQDAFLYTPEYFAAGGQVLTEVLPANRVLADPDDRALSRNFILFADWEARLSPDQMLVTKAFFERLYSDKLSTYGFAFRTSQWVANLRSEWQLQLPDPRNSLAIGTDLRFTSARTLQDFDAEPFSRRDLSTGRISANSRVAAGATTGPDGLNFWSTFSTASEESELLQLAAYLGGTFATGNRLTWHYGLRAENGWWRTGLPDAVNRASPQQRAARKESGSTFLYAAHLNPHLRLTEQLSIYAAVQFSKAIAPGDGGTVSGETNFTDAELFEAGIKWAGPNNRWFSSLSVYHWDQATFSSRDASAQPLRAIGLEWEATVSPFNGLTLLSAFTAQRVHFRGDLLGFGALPMSETDWALQGGILNADGGRAAPNNPDFIYAGMPELSAHLYAIADLPHGWQFAIGPVWRDAFYHDMQHSIKLPGSVIWSAQIRFQRARWSVRLRVDNLLDHHYWIGQEPVFSANTLVLQGEARRFDLRAMWQF